MNNLSVGLLNNSKLEFYPADADRWEDFEKLFGERGACGGCWCMSWRLKSSDFNKQKGAANKEAIKKIFRANEKPGILAYYEKKPIGWCAVAPREKYVRLEKSKVLKKIDEQPVWSVSCLFVAKEFRKKGLSIELIKAAVKFCKSQGARIVEAYSIVPYSNNIPAAFAWTGLQSSFEKAGFNIIEKKSKTRPIMRFNLDI